MGEEQQPTPDIEPIIPSSKEEKKDKKGFLASLFRFGQGAKGAGAMKPGAARRGIGGNECEDESSRL